MAQQPVQVETGAERAAGFALGVAGVLVLVAVIFSPFVLLGYLVAKFWGKEAGVAAVVIALALTAGGLTVNYLYQQYEHTHMCDNVDKTPSLTGADPNPAFSGYDRGAFVSSYDFCLHDNSLALDRSSGRVVFSHSDSQWYTTWHATCPTGPEPSADGC